MHRATRLEAPPNAEQRAPVQKAHTIRLSRVPVDLDPLAGSKIKAISHALLTAEPHPLEPGKTIILVGTADAVVTIWEAEDPRCGANLCQ